MFEPRFSFHSGKYLGVELVGCIVNTCLTLNETVKLFPKVAVLFCVPNIHVLVLLYILATAFARALLFCLF